MIHENRPRERPRVSFTGGVPIFNYTSLDPQGQRRQGTIEAPSKELALNKLREEGYTPLAVEPQKDATNLEDIFARYKEIKPDVLVYFTRQLATMIDSGMSPLRALGTLEEQEDNAKFREVIGQLIARIEAGTPMWQAFGEHPTVFNQLFVAMVRSGEESGNLHGALRELSQQLEKAARLRRAIKSATTYPKVVLAFAGVIVSILLLTIVPRFAKLFEDTVASTFTPKPGEPPPDTSLPMLTQVVVNISHLLYPDRPKTPMWWLEVAGRFFLLFIIIMLIRKLVKYILRQPGPRARWDAFKLRAPMKIGPLVQKVVVARFARTFASLLSSGVAAVEALEIVADTSGNVLVANAVLRAREQMLAGSTIAEPLARSEAFPPIVTRMIEVGEETGQLEQMLVKVAEFYEEEVEMAINGLTSLIEPVMILIVGSVIGVIIIAIYLPMFGIYDKVGTGAVFASPFSSYLNAQITRIRLGYADYRRGADLTRTPTL